MQQMNLFKHRLRERCRRFEFGITIMIIHLMSLLASKALFFFYSESLKQPHYSESVYHEGGRKDNPAAEKKAIANCFARLQIPRALRVSQPVLLVSCAFLLLPVHCLTLRRGEVMVFLPTVATLSADVATMKPRLGPANGLPRRSVHPTTRGSSLISTRSHHLWFCSLCLR